TPLRTIAQNGLDACPWVTTMIRTESPLRPFDDASGGPPGMRCGVPGTTIDDSRTVVVLPQPASAAAAMTSAASMTRPTTGRRRRRTDGAGTMDRRTVIARSRRAVRLTRRRAVRARTRPPAPRPASAEGFDLGERLRAALAALAPRQDRGRDERDGGHPDRPPER